MWRYQNKSASLIYCTNLVISFPIWTQSSLHGSLLHFCVTTTSLWLDRLKVSNWRSSGKLPWHSFNSEQHLPNTRTLEPPHHEVTRWQLNMRTQCITLKKRWKSFKTLDISPTNTSAFMVGGKMVPFVSNMIPGLLVAPYIF